MRLPRCPAVVRELAVYLGLVVLVALGILVLVVLGHPY